MVMVSGLFWNPAPLGQSARVVSFYDGPAIVRPGLVMLDYISCSRSYYARAGIGSRNGGWTFSARLDGELP